MTALLSSDPHRAFSGAELAEALQIPKHNMLTQLAEWTRLGFITRTHAGSYAIAPPRPVPAPDSSRSEPLPERRAVQRPPSN